MESFDQNSTPPHHHEKSKPESLPNAFEEAKESATETIGTLLDEKLNAYITQVNDLPFDSGVAQLRLPTHIAAKYGQGKELNITTPQESQDYRLDFTSTADLQKQIIATVATYIDSIKNALADNNDASWMSIANKIDGLTIESYLNVWHNSDAYGVEEPTDDITLNNNNFKYYGV